MEAQCEAAEQLSPAVEVPATNRRCSLATVLNSSGTMT
jgi:hypothetical protein